MAEHIGDRVGQQFGDYRRTRLLGKGSFGDVYLGEHVHDQSLAAVKVLQARLTAEDLKEFINETSTIFRMKHPNIVQLLDFGIAADDRPYLIMDYAPNGTLRQCHPKGTRLPLKIVVTYAKQIAAALQYAHDKKRIHRDVKPENILLGPNNEVLLSDFGIAVVAHSTRSLNIGNQGGTYPYMAPEQLQGKPRPASDQYALGIIVYEWLCGERPFNGTPAEIAMQHLVNPPPPLCEKVATISPKVEQVVMTALAKDAKDRFASVQAFATALEQASYGPTTGIATSQSMISTGAVTVPDQSMDRVAPPSQVSLPAEMVLPANPPVVSPDVMMPASLAQQRSLAIPPQQAAQHPETVTPPQQSLVTDGSLDKLQQSQRSISRRTVLIGLATIGTVEGLTWLIFAPHPHLLYIYRGHSSFVDAVAWSPDGRRIASGEDFGDGTVQVWDAATGGNIYTYRGHSNGVSAVAWSPDGRRIASGGGNGDKTVQVWDAATGGNIYTYRGHSNGVSAVAWSPDGRRIASGGDNVQVWDAANRGNVYTYGGHASDPNGYVSAVAWSPDGRRIASGSGDKTVQVWDSANGGNVYTYRGHSDGVSAVAWSPDGRRIASGGGYDKTVQVWDAATGGNIYTYRGHSNGVSAVAWSPDGRRIASGSYDKTVQVWDAATGGNVYTYRGDSFFLVGGVLTVAWSSDGRRIASGSGDGMVQVWVPG